MKTIARVLGCSWCLWNLVASVLGADITFDEAKNNWKPMTKAVQHVGVPGYQFQAGVLWDGSLVLGPLGGVPEQEKAPLGNTPVHLSVGFGQPMHFVDRHGSNRPLLRRWLEGGRLPIPHVETKDGALVWHQAVFAHLLGRGLDAGMEPRDDDVLVVQAQFQVRNPGPEGRTGQLWLHFGDVGQVALGYACEVRDLAAPIPHTFEAPYGLKDGKVRYVIPRPEKGSLRWHDELAPLPGVKNAPKRVIEWEVPLQGHDEAQLRIILPYGLVDREVGKRLAALDTAKDYKEVVGAWERLVSGPGQILTPDPFVNDYLVAVAGQMSQQVACRTKTRVWIYKTSPNNYEQYWPCNAAKALPTFDLRGLGRFSRPVLRSFVEYQTAGFPGAKGGEGYAKVPGYLGSFPNGINGYLLSHGLEMWTLASHYRITRDRAWLGEGPGSPLQAMLEGFNWVATQRRRTMREASGKKVPHWGLLPAAAAHDWLAGNTVFNDAACIYGMAEIVRLLREIKHPQAEALAKELNDYRTCLRDRYREARDRAKPVPLPNGTLLPYVPRMPQELDWTKPDWTITGYGPLRAGAWGAFDPRDELVDQALAFLEAGRPQVGGGREHLWSHYVETETMWPVGGPLFLARDDLPRFFEFLFNNLAAVLHHDWRVGVEHRDGVPSCAPGEGERWQIIRRMFVNETGGWDGSEQSLGLLQAIPQSWLRGGNRLSVKDMGTWFGGKVNLEAVVAADGDSVTVSAKLDLAVPPAGIRVRLRSGDGRPLRSAMVNGTAATVLDGDVIQLPAETTGNYQIVGRFK